MEQQIKSTYSGRNGLEVIPLPFKISAKKSASPATNSKGARERIPEQEKGLTAISNLKPKKTEVCDTNYVNPLQKS